MTESIHDENVFHEKDRTDDGLIEVLFNDGHSIMLQKAEVRPTSLSIDGVRVHYDELISSEGYILEPYTIYDSEDLVDFAEELELTYSPDGKVAIQTKAYANDLSFLAIAQTLGNVVKLEKEIIHEHHEDANEYPLRLRQLIDEQYELWVRLELRRQPRGVTTDTIMAQLAFIGAANDKVTMIPYINNVNGYQKDYIPEQLTLGYPWLYIGEDDYTET